MGKTTLAVNLAAAFHLSGLDTLLVDGDLYTPNIHDHLGSDVRVGLADVALSKMPLRSAIHRHLSGLRVIPSRSDLETLRLLTPKLLKDALFYTTALSDNVIVDAAAGLGDNATAVIEAADEVLLLSDLELPSLKDAKNAAMIAEALHIPVRGLVFTKVEKKKHLLSPFEAEKIVGIPSIGSIPFDKTHAKAFLQKHPLVISHPKSKAAKAYRELANQLY